MLLQCGFEQTDVVFVLANVDADEGGVGLFRGDGLAGSGVEVAEDDVCAG